METKPDGRYVMIPAQRLPKEDTPAKVPRASWFRGLAKDFGPWVLACGVLLWHVAKPMIDEVYTPTTRIAALEESFKRHNEDQVKTLGEIRTSISNIETLLTGKLPAPAQLMHHGHP